ncbi:hypothetical protein HZU75_06575 [Chitinibacter fontanus]|uniref:Uncharacterized protein n=1 Tax=Chitinibacter fontanus TaxID=1737446 RepID=A0A7D5Z555_9NEIS|nr:hypothetical protein [Chitinibacter fontanus]QLI81223.1 hypothetical protein HZU75_06575 [Chitinibacter fontanus]
MNLSSLIRPLRKKNAWLCMLILIAVTYFLWQRNPLPKDEELIAHFQAHRAEFEELIRRYRAYERSANKDTSLWFKEGNTPALYKQAGVESIDYETPIWLPNPYSVETAKKIDALLTTAKDFSLLYKYGALKIQLAPVHRYYSYNSRYVAVWKDLYFIPEVPRIEDGELLGPIYSNGKYSYRERIFPSLNRFPDYWKDFECVYRQIEQQWFLRMCNGH